MREAAAPQPACTYTRVPVGSQILQPVQPGMADFTWAPQTKLNADEGPSPRCWHTLTVSGDAVFLFGGLTADGPSNDLYKLTQSWG